VVHLPPPPDTVLVLPHDEQEPLLAVGVQPGTTRGEVCVVGAGVTVTVRTVVVVLEHPPEQGRVLWMV
jgi:hypothetical protein